MDQQQPSNPQQDKETKKKAMVGRVVGALIVIGALLLLFA